MTLKFRSSQLQSPQFAPASGPTDQAEAPNSDYRNVTVSHGIHRGRFPVGGLLVKDARRVLQKLIKIEASAVPVINGALVDEETRISEAVSLLSFVKPTSLKGMAETITIQGNEVQLVNGSGEKHVLGVGPFAEGVSRYTTHGLTDEPIPDNVKWIVTCGSLAVYIVELKPELRWVKWLAENSPAPWGPVAVSTDRQIATPYVVLKVPFRRGQLVSRVEIFYRNEPLRGPDGPEGSLYWPNLLNVSPQAYECVAWFCTQYLRLEGPLRGPTDTLSAVLHHLWGGSFNRSSEHHEQKSTFSLASEMGLDPRVTDIARWEAESRRDPRFALSVDWKPTGMTIRSLIEKEFKFQKVSPLPDNAAALGNILLRKAKPK